MRSSIRKRLTLAFVGLAIGPLLLVGVILAWQSFTTQEQQALNLQRGAAQQVSTQVMAFLNELENELHLVNQVQGLQKLDRDGQHNVLAELLSYQDAFESLDLLDSQGQEQVHLARSSVPSAVLGNRAKADEFVIPRTSGQTYYSPVRFDEATGEPFMTIAVPLLDVHTGLVDGVFVAEVRFKKIWDLIANLQVGLGQSVYIVDAQGKVVAHRNPSVVLQGTTFHVPDQDGIQPGLGSVNPTSALDPHESPSIQSLVARLTSPNVVLAVDRVRFGEQEFNVIAEQTVAEALALPINTILITTSLMMGTLVLSVALGLVIVRQIVQPIQAMATTAQAISAGDLSRQVQVASRDEVGVLAAAFNEMTAQLRQSLEGLEQERLLLRTVIDNLPDSVYAKDRQGRKILANCADLDNIGKLDTEVLGKTDAEVFPLEVAAQFEADDQSVLQSGQPVLNREESLVNEKGRQIWQITSKLPLKDAAGQIVGLVGIGHNITARKQAEEALRDLNTTLEQRVADRTHELAAANAQLTKLDQMKDEFVARISHELYTPLVNIKLYLGLLEHGKPGKHDQYMETLRHEAARLQQLIEDLFRISELDRDAVSIQIAPIDVNQLLAQLTIDRSGLARERGLRIDSQLSPDLPRAAADSTLLMQALSNLMTNATNYTPEGGMLTLSTALQSSDDRAWVTCTIRDTGPGISAKDWPHIFERFYRGEAASDYTIPGTGLGLSICQEIVNKFGGRITVESEPGHGAAFTIWLKLAD